MIKKGKNGMEKILWNVCILVLLVNPTKISEGLYFNFDLFSFPIGFHSLHFLHFLCLILSSNSCHFHVDVNHIFHDLLRITVFESINNVFFHYR